jgi:hypothetical protein
MRIRHVLSSFEVLRVWRNEARDANFGSEGKATPSAADEELLRDPSGRRGAA